MGGWFYRYRLHHNHFDGQADFADHIAAVRANDTATDDAAGFSIKISLVKPLSQPLAIARPEAAHGSWFGFCGRKLWQTTGFANPCHFRRGVGNAWNNARVEVGFVAGSFQRQVAFGTALCANIG